MEHAEIQHVKKANMQVDFFTCWISSTVIPGDIVQEVNGWIKIKPKT
jgi:hypothetical protein